MILYFCNIYSVILSTLNISQIHAECKRFGKAYSLRSVAVYGGGSMWEQAKALQEGAEIVVCTPVRPAFVFNLAPVNKIP